MFAKLFEGLVVKSHKIAPRERSNRGDTNPTAIDCKHLRDSFRYMGPYFEATFRGPVPKTPSQSALVIPNPLS